MPRDVKSINLYEWRRAGGFPSASLTGDEVRLESGNAAFIDPSGQAIRWRDGDLLIEVSTSLSRDELLRVANSMR